MDDPKKPEFKSAKAQKLLLSLEDVFDPAFFDWKKKDLWRAFTPSW